jgi:radical SAM enzyme (rSAM/lipoprotein system)
MPFEDFLNAVLPLKNMYPPDSITVVITGGEPLLRKDLPDCGKQLRKNGFRWGIVTNGYLYDNQKHTELLSSGMGAITVSLDGLEMHHNWLRCNPKSFQNAVDAIEIIATSQRLNYDIVTCVNKLNINELEEIKQLLLSKKVKNWRLFTIAPIGRAAHNPDLHLSPKELHFLLAFIAKTRNEHKINTYFSCESYLGKYERKVRDTFFFCRAGVNIASVLIDGSISACPNIDRTFSQGNIYKDNIAEIWENKFQIMRHRQWAKKGICTTCKAFQHCKGGAMHLWDKQLTSNQACIFHRMNH